MNPLQKLFETKRIKRLCLTILLETNWTIAGNVGLEF